MKKILLTMCVLLAFSCSTYAKTPINFLYIHGSDQGPVEEFQEWIDRMQPDMKTNLSENELFQEKVLKDAYIKDEPEMVFWADRTKIGRSVVAQGLSISQKLTSCFSNAVRSFVAYMLHDVVWLQKYSNMKPILEDVNKTVISNSKKGEATILVGYSAGTLITYQYMLNKSRFLKPAVFMKKHQKELQLPDVYIEAANKYADMPTCIDAIVDSKIAFMNADGGLMANPNIEQRKMGVRKLKAQTELSCAPENAVLGIINFGSPLVVFYSDVANSESQLQYFTRKLEQELIESDQFFLTVNYKKDPIAVPISNVTYAGVKKVNSDVQNGGGFTYHALVSGGKNIAAAHLKYWDNTNSYTKLVAKSYEEGYKQFYGIKD